MYMLISVFGGKPYVSSVRVRILCVRASDAARKWEWKRGKESEGGMQGEHACEREKGREKA